VRRIMAVCDADSCYAGRFAEVANRVKSIPFEVVAFTSLARLKEFTEKEQVELLLVGDNAEEADLTDVKVERVIRLSEEGTVKDDRPAIYKYQSSDSVLREVMACCQVWEQPFTSQTVRSKSRVLGVYSPLSRCGKTSFAFTLGKVLAQNGKALLLSLEECSGLSKLTATVYGSTLSDVLYYYRQGEYSRLRLSSSIYSWGGLDYVPPVTYAEDLAGLRGTEVAGLVGAIAADGMYEAIVVDLGHFTGGIEDTLMLCDLIYMPVKEDAVASAKLEEWKDYLNASGRDCLWEKIRLLKLPRPRLAYSCETYLEQLLWGEFGDFVRELVCRSGRTTIE